MEGAAVTRLPLPVTTIGPPIFIVRQGLHTTAYIVDGCGVGVHGAGGHGPDGRGVGGVGGGGSNERAGYHIEGPGAQVARRRAKSTGIARTGGHFTERFPFIAQLLHELPAKAAVLDGEVVAGDADGRPNFAWLHVRWTQPGTALRVRLAGSQRPGRAPAASGEAPGGPAGPAGAVRLPSRFTIRTIRRLRCPILKCRMIAMARMLSWASYRSDRRS